MRKFEMIMRLISYLCVVDRGEQEGCKPSMWIVFEMVECEVVFVEFHMGIVYRNENVETSFLNQIVWSDKRQLVLTHLYIFFLPFCHQSRFNRDKQLSP